MRIMILLMAALAIAACKQNPDLPAVISPYKIDVQQGNVVTQEMVGKLKSGLTRSQVRFVLGSPLVTDMFHSDRWDYIYLLQRQGKPDERRRLTVIFDGDKLLRLEGDVVITDKSLEPEPPAPKPPAAVAPAPKPAPVKPVAATPAPKPEAAKPAEKPPVAAAPAAKPQTGLVPPRTAVQSEPVKSAPSTAQSAKPEAAKTDAKTDAAAAAPKADAAKTDAAKADAAKADAAKAEAATADEKKEPPKRGMFGRMLDKIGF
jgi:outer membrane protein assembly factor BamE